MATIPEDMGDINIEDMEYEEVPEDIDLDDNLSGGNEWDILVSSMKKQHEPTKTALQKTQNFQVTQASVDQIPPPIDDFFRNFLNTNNLHNTLNVFEEEWYDMTAKGIVPVSEQVSEVYFRCQRYEEKSKLLQQDLDKVNDSLEKITNTFDKLRRERDYHRMHHRRVVQEKNKLVNDIKRLKKHCEKYEPTLKEMKKKYETALKDKMLLVLERDKLFTKTNSLQEKLNTLENVPPSQTHSISTIPHKGKADSHSSTQKNIKKSSSTNGVKKTSIVLVHSLPSHDRPNLYLQQSFPQLELTKFSPQKTFKAHELCVSGVNIHPKRPLIVTISDDMTWKLWSLPQGELVMTGTGHLDWLSNCDFHPAGSHLITSSGDGTVKLWDFAQSRCTHTFPDHNQPVWDCCFIDSGDFFLSSSQDKTIRLWDLTTQKSVSTLRGHVDAVNSVAFKPFSNILASASGDKTVSLWDSRAGLCIHTFYNHNNAVNHVAFNLQGDSFVSSDIDGIVKVWDLRFNEMLSLSSGVRHQSVNETRFDPTGQNLVCGREDGIIKIYSVLDGHSVGELTAHQDAIQGLQFDPLGKYLVSCSSDCSFKIWA